MILEDLISTNILQRGIGNVNPMKMAKCIVELERIYGIRNGGSGSNQYKKVEDSTKFNVAKSQAELSEQIGVSQQHLINYKKLLTLIPELQDLIENGELKASVGYKVLAKLPQDEQYEQFKKSIQEDGIITPLIVAPDMTLISGHQRLKAATDLQIQNLPVIIREDLNDEDEKLKKLLASNFGRTKNDPAKQRKVAVQYVELCGLRNGEKLGDNRRGAVSQEQIATELGISERTLRELLEIERKLTPELKDLLDEGKITKTTASKVFTKLSVDEQEQLIQEYGKDYIANLTQKKAQELVENMKPKIIDNTDYQTIDRLKEKIKEKEDDGFYNFCKDCSV